MKHFITVAFPARLVLPVVILLTCLHGSSHSFAQAGKIDEARFFVDTTTLEITLTSDFKHLQRHRNDNVYQPAAIVIRFSQQDSVSGTVQIRARGALRKEICATPPITVKFNGGGSPELAPLGALKLVTGCNTRKRDEQLVLREYLAYKIYTLFTGMSFRVRLARIHFVDEMNKLDPYTQYGFFIEDIDDLARRNGCKHIEATLNTEQTNRKQMTLVALYQYMIGNTDYSVRVQQNIHLIRLRHDTLSAPFVVPYDFDYTGLVDADYAIPNPDYTELNTIRDRKYLGFPRTMEELETVFAQFRSNRSAIENLIMCQEGLSHQSQQSMISYINEFYQEINDPKAAKYIFIKNARRR